ncbi:5-formyltetrahydrofolate cyclo-ligase [Aestuariibacter halophilus]|uniref:5-formyltetrahydrofolate cyclo-ligase n=1 Tax=Fluctibacter halophilus TaxID=226011 RepID=A0ABS8G8R9_9ALTE|nr:5-formyltetrahydrofolate cyclo-ligase [Aestuariibacter halophilus]MCC2616491.1 5-formyltetrahydrofolate cyclo-ligase [Aestuariibacter halophilus]
MTDSRNALRQRFRTARRELSAAQQQQAAQAVCQQLLQSPLLKDARRIGAYLSNDGEVDLSPFIQHLWQQGHSVYLPVLHPVCQGHLLFLDYHPQTDMVANRFGIPEPQLRCQAICPTHALDVILTPLVAFDRQGGRLGMGGGYYDRTLAGVDTEQSRFIGIAHDCQQADALPMAAWDIPMAAIVTPSQIITTTGALA